jgi:two-component system LytT family sensor kinase
MLGYKSLRQFLKTYIVIIFVGLVTFVIRLSKFDQLPFDFQLKLLGTSVIVATILWESLRSLNLFLNKTYPFERNLTGRIVLQLVCGSIIGIIVRFFIYLWGEPNVPFRLDSLFLAATWALYVIIPVGINLGFFTIYFLERWKDSIVQAERLEKEKSQVQFDNLRNQLNPHFLFNALTSLNSLIFEDQQLASAFLQQLSKVYRYVLQNKDKNFVLLNTELEFISNYVFLLETRFSKALQINFNINEEAKQKAIVPVTLQILIQNALKHNIVDKDKKLTIDVLTVGDYLIVSNNLQVRKTVETSNKQGLDNLKSLYAFLTDKEVIVEPTTDRFYVKIPLL